MKNKITMRDVAKDAGVSVATVSYVLNDKKNIPAATRQKIHNSIAKLGYEIDLTARTLATQKSYLIGVMFPLSDEKIFIQENPFYNEFFYGIEYAARTKGYDVLVTGISNEVRILDWIKKRNLDGIIFMGIFKKELEEAVSLLNVPVILIDAYEEHSANFYNICSDDKNGGYLATKYLLELGHINIAVSAGYINYDGVDKRRFTGYRQALEEYGFSINPNNIYTEEMSFDGGFKAGCKIASNRNITAVFAFGDIMATGIISGLRSKGINVPEDLSVIGFDDLSICRYINPGLTTIRQDIPKKGILAADTLVNIIEKKPPFYNKLNTHIVLPVSLVIRESTKIR